MTTFSSKGIGDTMVLTFDNAPRLIAYDEIRIADGTIYSYFDVSGLADGIKLTDSDLNDLCFTYTFTETMTSGQVIKISGCSAHLINDSDFKDGQFTSISITPGEYGAPNIHEFEVYFYNDRSATIKVNDKFIYNCYWYMEADDSCLIQYPVLENDWRSASIYKISDGKYEFPFYYSKRDSIYSYTVILEKNI